MQYPYQSASMYVLFKDNELVIKGTEGECWNYLHHNTSSSVYWALSYEGWRMEAV